jgi:hypothetical protein
MLFFIFFLSLFFSFPLFCLHFVVPTGGFYAMCCAVGMAQPCPPNGLFMNDLSFYFFYNFDAWRRIGTKIK